MKVVAIVVLLVCGLHASYADETIVLGVNGKTKHEIVVPDKYGNESEKQSVSRAAELIQRLFAAGNIKIDIVNESAKNKDKRGIYLGATNYAKRNGVDVKSLKGWSSVHKTVGKDVIIVGNDQDDPIAKRVSPWNHAIVLGKRPYLVTLHSAAEFLYRYCGARFFKPGKAGIEFMPVSILKAPGNLNSLLEPWYREHNFSKENKELFNIANHCGSFQRVWYGGGHQHWQAIIPQKHFKSHPEYFTLVNGLRTVVGRRGHLCFSNPKVRQLIYEHILSQCDKGYDIIEVGQNDGFTPCQCEQCFDMYGIKPVTTPKDGIAWLQDPAWGEKIWRMHLDMAKKLLNDRPGKKMLINAYGPCKRPPTGIQAFPENVIVELADSSLENFDNWRDVEVPGGFGAYLYTWGNYQVPGYTPLREISYVREESERFVENKVHVVNLDGKPLLEYALEGPNIYAYLRLGMYPDLKDADELFNEYVESAFMEVSVPMRRFFVELQKAAALWGINKKYIMKMGRDPIRALGIMYTPGIMNKLEEELAGAEEKAYRTNVKDRLKSVRLEFDYLKDIVDVIFAWHHFQFDTNSESFNRLLVRVEKRNKNLKKSSITSKLKDNGRYLGIPPFNWDVEAMRKKGYESLQDKTTVAVFAAEKPVLDSTLWDLVQPAKLEPVLGDEKPISTDTTFKLMVDDENLYIRVTGKQNAPLRNFPARGRDCEIWLAESITFQISPTADKSRYYYFSYDSIKDSYAEAEHGFVTDILDPRYGWSDWLWNGKWSYETKIKDNVWESMAIVPFKTINAKAPSDSDKWGFNIGRIHFNEAGKREFSAWNKKLNKSYIAGDAFLGYLTFRRAK